MSMLRGGILPARTTARSCAGFTATIDTSGELTIGVVAMPASLPGLVTVTVDQLFVHILGHESRIGARAIVQRALFHGVLPFLR